MNIGTIGYAGVGRSGYSELVKAAIAEEERKQRELLLQDLGIVNKVSEADQRNLYQLMVNMVNEGIKAKELLESFELISEQIAQEPTIDQLKKQIKYSKNPLEVKMLNKKLNQMYKNMKGR